MRRRGRPKTRIFKEIRTLRLPGKIRLTETSWQSFRVPSQGSSKPRSPPPYSTNPVNQIIDIDGSANWMSDDDFGIPDCGNAPRRTHLEEEISCASNWDNIAADCLKFAKINLVQYKNGCSHDNTDQYCLDCQSSFCEDCGKSHSNKQLSHIVCNGEGKVIRKDALNRSQFGLN